MNPLYAPLFFMQAAPEVSPDPAKLYQLLVNGSPAGKAYVKRLFGEDGKYRFVITLFLTTPKGPVRVKMESLYDGEGAPLQRVVETTGKDQLDRSTAIFRPGSVQITQLIRGKTTVKDYPLNSVYTVKDPSLFWFAKNQPQVGESRSFFAFDFRAMRWGSVQVSYEGRKTAKISGKDIEGHAVKSKKGDSTFWSFFADDGEILMFDDGSMRIERVMEESGATRRNN